MRGAAGRVPPHASAGPVARRACRDCCDRLARGVQGVPEPIAIPATLIGVWKTEDPRYEGRHFELTVDTVRLAMGQNGQTAFPIRKFEKNEEPRATVYSVAYLNLTDGVTDTLSFSYEPANGGVIRFRNQRNIRWQRDREPRAEDVKDQTSQ
jgi:hypothetical protein